jgi:hypothetical protein
MRVVPGHDNKIIVPDKTKEKRFTFNEVQTRYD